MRLLLTQSLFTPGTPFYAIVEWIFYTTKDVRNFNNSMLYAIARANPLPDPKDFGALQDIQSIADTQSFIQGLSELELALLICAARAEVKLESDTLNFNLAYDEYYECATRFRNERRAAIPSTVVAGYRVWSKRVARSSWERLEDMDLIVTVVTTLTKTNAAGDELKMVKVDASLLELGNIIGRNHPLFSWTRL
jgi:origin recognition complex subunit 4